VLVTLWWAFSSRAILDVLGKRYHTSQLSSWCHISYRNQMINQVTQIGISHPLHASRDQLAVRLDAVQSRSILETTGLLKESGGSLRIPLVDP